MFNYVLCDFISNKFKFFFLRTAELFFQMLVMLNCDDYCVNSARFAILYSMVTWLFASGLAQGSVPSLRAFVILRVRRWERAAARGKYLPLSSGNPSVSVHANPNMIPWSPAPWSDLFTPWEILAACAVIF